MQDERPCALAGTALAVAVRSMRESDRRDSLGEVPTPEIDFETFPFRGGRG